MESPAEHTQVPTTVANPFAMGHVAARPEPQTGLVAIEMQRAVTEVQARMTVARRFPRDRVQAMDAILIDCQRPSLAEAALYSYARGGTDIEGPSIRLLEAIAARWGNISAGFKEVNRGDGVSDVLVEAYDLETGDHDYRQFQVRHIRDTKGGGYALRDQRDVYEVVANMAQRRKREVLRAVIPRDVVETAVRQCKETMAANADTSPEAMKRMVEAFGAFEVTRDQIEARIQRRLDAITPAQVVGLKKVYASLRDGMSEPGDWFEQVTTREPANDPGASPEAPATGNAGLKQRMQNMRNRRGRSSPEEERTGQVPATEQPTLETALGLVESGDDDAAADIAQALGNGAVKRVLDAIKARKEREEGGGTC